MRVQGARPNALAMRNDTYPLYILPGDGIGKEVMREVRRVIDWFGTERGLNFDLDEGLVGGASYDVHGVPITDEVMDRALEMGTVLFGAVGGPQYDSLDFNLRPERGLLRLRKDMELFANLRPAICFDALTDASSLKPELVSGLDILIVRELTGGVYFGEPKHVVDLPDGQREGVDTQRYTTEEIRRIARVAFDLAGKRNGLVHSSEKSNVMQSGVLWKEEVTHVHATEFASIKLEHILADNCGMQLVRAPKQFDVIVCDNLFGDMLSDVAAMLTGSLGMLPSASLGATDANGKRMGMYEPVHGSAPDIAGEDKANPLACLLSFAMALRYSFDLGAEADRLEKAAEAVLAKGYRTGDIMSAGMNLVSTTQMTDAILEELKASA